MDSKPHIIINNRKIGSGYPVYVIAEMSANHSRDFDKAVEIIKAAKAAGADAIKIQTYRPDTITIDCRNDYFRIKGTIWNEQYLYDLYKEAFTPWEWQPEMKKIADDIGLDFFSSPFDISAVNFLETIEVPAYKVASFELVDIPLIKRIAETGKPIMLSTGMASLGEIETAVNTASAYGGKNLALLKCTSAYPAPADEMNLRTIKHLSETFNVPAGLSDHSLGSAVAIAAIALGACIIEKHFTLSRNLPGPDSQFSMEPHEFKEMVNSIRLTEKALGTVNYQPTENEKASLTYRRSLFAVKDVRKGEVLTNDVVRSIRPAYGLHPGNLDKVIGRKARKNILKGTPLKWDLIE